MGSFQKSAWFVLREILGLAIIVLLMIGASRLSAEEPLPSQDEAIARAVENHPDIIAAKAKLALAESELNGKRMEVSRQVLQGYSGLKNLEAQMSAIKAKLDAVKQEFGHIANAAKARRGIRVGIRTFACRRASAGSSAGSNYAATRANREGTAIANWQ